MHNVWLLLKIQWQTFIGRLFKNRKNHSMYFGVGVLLIITATFIFIFTTNAITTLQSFIELENKGLVGAHELAIFTSSTFSIMIFLFVTLFRSISPNKSSDTNLLLALPIKKMHIVLAHNLYNFIFDFSCFLLTLLPNFIVYCFMIKDASLMIIVRGLLFSLLLTFLSNAFGGLLSNFFSYIAKKMKHYSLFQTIVSFILIFGYLAINLSVQTIVTRIGNTSMSVEEFKNRIFIIKYLMNYLLHGETLFIIIFGAFCLSLYTITVYISAKRLGNISLANKIKTDKIYYKKQSVLSALIKKEIRQYFNSPIYVLNTGFSGVIYFGFSVAILLLGLNKGLAFLNLFPNISSDFIALLIFSMLLGGFVITGSSISLEKNSLWILKSHPINMMTLFLSKILANIIMTGIVALISFPFMLAFVSISNFWSFLIIPFSASIVSSTFGLIINLKIPKMKWEREEEVIKQSLAGGLSLLLPIPVLALPFVVQFTLGNQYLSFNAFAICYLLILVLLEILMLVWLKTKGGKVFNQIN